MSLCLPVRLSDCLSVCVSVCLLSPCGSKPHVWNPSLPKCTLSGFPTTAMFGCLLSHSRLLERPFSYMFCKMHSAVPSGMLVRIYLFVNLCVRLSVCFSGWPSVCLHMCLSICVLDYVSAPRSARWFVGRSASVLVYSDYVIVCRSAWPSSCLCARQSVC